MQKQWGPLTARDLHFNGSLPFKEETMSSIMSQWLHSDSFYSSYIQGCRHLQVLRGQASPPTHLFVTLGWFAGGNLCRDTQGLQDILLGNIVAWGLLDEV